MDHLEVFGTDGVLQLALRQEGEEEGPSAVQTTDTRSPIVGPAGDLTTALDLQIDHFLGCVARGEESSVIPIRDAVAGIALAEQIVDSCLRQDH